MITGEMAFVQFIDPSGAPPTFWSRIIQEAKTLPSASAGRRAPLEVIQSYEVERCSLSREEPVAQIVNKSIIANVQLAIARCPTPSEHSSIVCRRDISARLQELRALRDGWLDGDGIAPSEDGLDWLAVNLGRFYPDSGPSPYIYPLPDGGVQIEWAISPEEPSLKIDFKTRIAEWHALGSASDEPECVDLNNEESWKRILGRLEALPGANAP